MYERKKDYFWLIHNYLNGTLNLLEFRIQFMETESENLEMCQKFLENYNLLNPTEKN